MANSKRLGELRALMRNERQVKEPLTAYIVLTDDAHQVSVHVASSTSRVIG